MTQKSFLDVVRVMLDYIEDRFMQVQTNGTERTSHSKIQLVETIKEMLKGQ